MSRRRGQRGLLPRLEHRSQPVITPGAFVVRQARFLMAIVVLMLASLAIGAAGYHVTEHLGWLDSVYAAAMILTGMGPVGPVHSDAGKIFATVYALFSAVVFLTSVGLFLSPMVHRVLHRLHMEAEDSVRSGGG